MLNNSLISIDLVEAARRSETLKAQPVEDLRRNARDYERFLNLVKRHGGPVAPTRAIDEMWHLHMLHPVAYFNDCTRLFGRILDHDGGFGTDPAERPILGRVFARTAALWKKEFGVPYVAVVEKCWHDCKSRCWHACSSIDVATAQDSA